MSVRYSSRPDLPQIILRALEDPYYEEGLNEHWEQIPEALRAKYQKNNFSVTTLPRSPRQRELFARHSHRIVVDPLSGFWKMFGHTIHSWLENYGEKGDMIEARLGMEVVVGVGVFKTPVYLHGAADRYAPKLEKIEDYKITSAMTMRYGVKEEYEAQLNVLAYIWRKNGHKVSKISNIFIFRDWSARNVKEDPDHWYPKEQILEVEITMWSDAVVEKYILARITAHLRAKKLKDDELPFCTDAERWVRDSLFKVFKFDKKKNEWQVKAKFMGESRAEAEAWMKNPDNAFDRLKGPDKKNTPLPDPTAPFTYEIRELKPKPARCEYCEIAAFCNQRQAELTSGDGGEEEEEG
jgi:hypothetical protein